MQLQQCVVAEWLGHSVTVRLRARVRVRARKWDFTPSPFFFFFFVCVKNVTNNFVLLSWHSVEVVKIMM